MSGVFFHSLAETVSGHIVVFVSLAALCAVFFLLARKWQIMRLVSLALCLISLMYVRYDLALMSVEQRRLAASPLLGLNAVHVGEVISDPITGMKNISAIVREPSGVVLRVSFPALTEISYGDEIEWSCRPEEFDDDYGQTMIRVRGVDLTCIARSPPKVSARAAGADPLRLIYAFRNRLRRVASTVFPDPEGPLVLGLLIGDTSGVPKRLLDDFRAVGVSHVLAVSGSNVAQVAEALLLVMAVCTIPRRRAIPLVWGGLGMFAVLSGAESSVMRATVMGSIGLLAGLLGRRQNGVNALLLAATIMIVLQPFVLRYDVGFQLSFAATLGLMVFSGPFGERLKFLPERFGLREMIACTLAASLAILPVSLAAFGSFPLIGLIANVPVVMAMPFAMLFGALGLGLGLIHPILGLLPAVAGVLVLRTTEEIISIFARLPAPKIDLHLGPLGSGVLVLGIGLLWLLLRRADVRKKNRHKVKVR